MLGKKRTKRTRYLTLRLTNTTQEPPIKNNVICNIRRAVSLEDITTGSLILESILSFLDTPSLKSARLVSKKWDDACLPLLSKRTRLNIALFYESLYLTQEELIPRATLYSSWKLTVEKGQNQFPSIYGAHVKSLFIINIDLNKACITWIRDLLSVWCPQLTKLHLHFLDVSRRTDFQLNGNKVRSEESYGFAKSLKNDRSHKKFQATLDTIKNHSFLPFPVLPNLQTISVGVGCDRLNSLFAFNLICSCPNLKRLFFIGIHHHREDVRESGFRILEYLSRRPDITTKLEAFHLEVSMGRNPKRPEDGQVHHLYPEQERQPVRLLTDTADKQRNIPPMQFSDKLKYLHWDVLWVGKIEGSGYLGLLPGTMNKNIAGNLTRLSTRKAVMDPSTFPTVADDRRALIRWFWSRQREQRAGGCVPALAQQVKCLQIHYLLMPKLVELEIGLRSCYTICLSDLLDAAPILRTLKITGCECHDVLKDSVEMVHCYTDLVDDLPSDDIWQGSSDFLLEARPHKSLKFLDAGVSMRSHEILQKIVQKFPNLEELWIGPPLHREPSNTKLALESAFNILQDLRSLQRLKWNYQNVQKVDLADLIENLIGAGRLPTLERYELKLNQMYDSNSENHVRLES
jgi:hypothetical protein